jgi:hypothetical protein
MLYALSLGADRVLWCDPDLYFFASPQLLFDAISPQTILLTPHFRCQSPTVDPANFLRNYTEGMFQAGFVGAGKDASEPLRWWTNTCLSRMEVNYTLGLYVDQKYLDLLPVVWKDTRVFHHRGCNVSEWNRTECQRRNVGEKVLINGEFPIIFIHFTDWTIFHILNGGDPLLTDHLEEYKNTLRSINPSIALRLPPPQIDKQPKSPAKQGRLRYFVTRLRKLACRLLCPR